MDNRYPRFSYNDAYNESLKSQKLVEKQMYNIVKDAPRSINEAEYEAKTSTSYGTSAGSLNPSNLPLGAYKHNVGDLAASEKRIAISNFLQNLNNTTTLLTNDKILRTVNNKNIVTNIGTQTPDSTPGRYTPPGPGPGPPDLQIHLLIHLMHLIIQLLKSLDKVNLLAHKLHPPLLPLLNLNLDYLKRLQAL